MGDVQLVLAVDGDSEAAAFYLDEKLVGSFDLREVRGYGAYNGSFTDALAELFANPVFDGIEFTERPSWMPSFKCRGTWDSPEEYDQYWPESLSQVPVRDDTYVEQAVDETLELGDF
jgi:hypothetical protein